MKRKDIEKSEGMIQSLFGSPVRTMILSSLHESPKTITELAEKFDFAPGTIYHRLKELKHDSLVEKREGRYQLSPLGIMGTLKARETLSYVYVMEKYKKLFFTHDIDALPHEFLIKCSALASTELFCEGVDPSRPVTLVSDVFSCARKRIYGVSNIGTSEWARILEKKADEGVDISLLVSDEVHEKIKEKSILLSKNVTINKGPFRYVLVLTEDTMLLALNKKDVLDMTNIIVGKNIEAIEWGMNLFSHERQRLLSKSF